MTRSKIKLILCQHESIIRARFKIRSVFLFGSFARCQEKKDSYIDILVQTTEETSLLDISGLSIFLEEELFKGFKVDVVTEGGLREELRSSVGMDCVPIW